MARKKKKATRVLTAAQKRKYRRNRKAKLATIDGKPLTFVDMNEPNTTEIALKPKQQIENVTQERDALRLELKSQYDREDKTLSMLTLNHGKEVRGLQNEIGMLRAMLARMTFGGVHVHDVERVGPGAV
jgi:hypothetical protein